MRETGKRERWGGIGSTAIAGQELKMDCLDQAADVGHRGFIRWAAKVTPSALLEKEACTKLGEGTRAPGVGNLSAFVE